MTREETLERIRAALAGLEHGLEEPRDGMACALLGRDRLREALERLRERAGFDGLTFITAVDRFGREPRFEVLHQLLSFTRRDRVRLRTLVPGDDPVLPSCTDLWPGASFMERECFDMFGVRFEGHPDLRRLYMPEEYVWHPLRKDFPHKGIEPDRLYREWDRRRREEWSPAADRH